LYVGGHVGYSRGNVTNTLFDPDPSRASDSFGSLYGGLQFGYNYLLPSRFLLGIETDISFPDFLQDGVITGRATAQSTAVVDKIDYVATLRGRFGYAFDHWLIYATGGFAWSQARFVETPGLIEDEDNKLRIRTGWALGMGGEVAIAWDWTARLEYLYYRFGSVGAAFPSGTGYESAFDIHMLRLGLNRRFGWPDTGSAPSWTSDPRPIASDNWNIHGQYTFVGQVIRRSILLTRGQTVSLAGSSSKRHRARPHSSAFAHGTAPKSMSIPNSCRASVLIRCMASPASPTWKRKKHLSR
jgi:high affinity Mn2+ porin